jgi:iron complex transport system substrate-binding protein
MRRGPAAAWLSIFVLAFAARAWGEVRVTDALGREVALARPATRVVSLAPHTTEMLFALGVGERVVATVRFADYPPEARAVPRIGDAFSVSLEALLAKRPEIVFAWATGSPHWLVPRLEDFGIPLYLSGPTRLEDIPEELAEMGALVGAGERARELSAALEREIDELADTQGKRPRAFVQISMSPIYTVSDTHIIGAAMRRCAINVFGDLAQPSPQVSLEAVLAKRPERLVVTVDATHPASGWEEFWAQWGWQERLVFVSADLLSRPGLRMIEGVKRMCAELSK